MNIRSAEYLLDNYWDHYLPVDPKKIAVASGVIVIPFDISDSKNTNLSGAAEVVDDVEKIFYSPFEHNNRQRFTIAHELGHHALGHTINGICYRDNIANYSTDIRDYKEIEANQFAAKLLMPEDAIYLLIRREGITDITQLANIFSVSTTAMYWRLKGLGLAR